MQQYFMPYLPRAKASGRCRSWLKVNVLKQQTHALPKCRFNSDEAINLVTLQDRFEKQHRYSLHQRRRPQASVCWGWSDSARSRNSRSWLHTGSRQSLRVWATLKPKQTVPQPNPSSPCARQLQPRDATRSKRNEGEPLESRWICKMSP